MFKNLLRAIGITPKAETPTRVNLASPTPENIEAARLARAALLNRIGGTDNPFDYVEDLYQLAPDLEKAPPATEILCGCCGSFFVLDLQRIGAWVSKSRRDGTPTFLCALCVLEIDAKVFKQTGKRLRIPEGYDPLGQQLWGRSGSLRPRTDIAFARYMLKRAGIEPDGPM